MKHLLLLCCAFVAFTAAAQKEAKTSLPTIGNDDKETNQQKVISKGAHNSNIYDLFAETLTDENGKVYYFQFSPIYQKKGYTTLLSNYKNVVFLQKMTKPLDAVWVLKNNHLYLQDFTCFRIGTEEEFLSQKQAMLSDLEPFLEAKKDDKGHIKAEFLTGEMHLYAQKPNEVGKEQQRYFVAHFKKGKLLKIEETDKDWNAKQENKITFSNFLKEAGMQFKMPQNFQDTPLKGNEIVLHPRYIAGTILKLITNPQQDVLVALSIVPYTFEGEEWMNENERTKCLLPLEYDGSSLFFL